MVRKRPIEGDFAVRFVAPLSVLREHAAQQDLMPHAEVCEIPVWVEPEVGDARIAAVVFAPAKGLDVEHLLDRIKRALVTHGLGLSGTITGAAKYNRLQRNTLSTQIRRWEEVDTESAEVMGWSE
jgi:hypothetical protein